MGWKEDNRGAGPWPFAAQPNKWGYLNNPRWVPTPTAPISYDGRESEEPQIWDIDAIANRGGEEHFPCGHWHKVEQSSIVPPTPPPGSIESEIYFELIPGCAGATPYVDSHTDLLSAESFIPINANSFDGTVEWFFEIVANNNSGEDFTLQVVDLDGNVCAAIDVPDGTIGGTGYELYRYRTVFTPTVYDDVGMYGLKIVTTGLLYGADCMIALARIIVQQVDHTKTAMQIPLFGNYYALAMQEYIGFNPLLGADSYPYDYPLGSTLQDAHTPGDPYIEDASCGLSIWRYAESELSSVSKAVFSVYARAARPRPTSNVTRNFYVFASLAFQHFHYMLYTTTGADVARADATPNAWIDETQVHTDNVSGRVYTPVPGSLVEWDTAPYPFSFTRNLDLSGLSGTVYFTTGGELYIGVPPEFGWEHWGTTTITIAPGTYLANAVLTVFSTNTNQMTWRLNYDIVQTGADTDLTVSLYDITAGAVVPNTDLVWPLEEYYSNIGSRQFAEFDVSHLVDGHEYRAGITCDDLNPALYYEAELMDAQLLLTLDNILYLTTWRRCLLQNNEDIDMWSPNWIAGPAEVNLSPQVIPLLTAVDETYFEVTSCILDPLSADHTSSIELLPGDGTGVGTTEIVPSRLTLVNSDTYPHRMRSVQITLVNGLVYGNRQSNSVEGDNAFGINGFIVTKCGRTI